MRVLSWMATNKFCAEEVDDEFFQPIGGRVQWIMEYLRSIEVSPFCLRNGPGRSPSSSRKGCLSSSSFE